MEKLLSTRQAAKVVGVSYLTLRRYAKLGKFRFSKNPITRYMWFDKDLLQEDIKKLILDKAL